MPGGQQSDSAAGNIAPSHALAVTGSEATGATGTLTYEELTWGGEEALTGEGMTMSAGDCGVGFTIDLPNQ